MTSPKQVIVPDLTYDAQFNGEKGNMVNQSNLASPKSITYNDMENNNAEGNMEENDKIREQEIALATRFREEDIKINKKINEEKVKKAKKLLKVSQV